MFLDLKWDKHFNFSNASPTYDYSISFSGVYPQIIKNKKDAGDESRPSYSWLVSSLVEKRHQFHNYEM